MYRTTILAAALLLSTGLLVACNRTSPTAQAPAPTTTAEQQAPETQAQAPAPQTQAQAPAPGSANETVSAIQDATAGLVGTITAEMTTTTQGFAKAAAVSDMYEVEAGKLALQRSTSPEVKKFAQMMIDAHTMTTNTLKPLAMKANVELPTMLDARRQGMLDNLMGAAAQDFDGRYLTQQTNAHQEALILFRGYAKDGDNADVKQFAAATVPAIEMHLNMAKMLEESRKAANQNRVSTDRGNTSVPANR